MNPTIVGSETNHQLSFPPVSVHAASASSLCRLFCLVGLVVVAPACRGREAIAQPASACYAGQPPGWQKDLRVTDVAWDLYVPPEEPGRPVCRRLLLVLPGWKFPRSDWIKKSRLEQLAKAHNYILVLPEMGSTLYESRYFPETSMRWNRLPGGAFLRDVFFPALRQDQGLLLPDHPNYVLGLSTGGRGVVMVALQNPGLFRAGAALSGDFDQTTESSDRLMTAVYGDSRQHRRRWEDTDNPVSEIQKTSGTAWSMPLYIAHGADDRVVPPSHSRWLFDVLRKTKPQGFPVVLHEKPQAGHDYGFWDAELEHVFRFFEGPDSFVAPP